MPRNYANAVIYKIARRDGTGECYVGSTCDIRSRRRSHKCSCTNPNEKHHKSPVYQHICANGGWDEWECVPIEAFPCENKTELEIRERHWVDELKPALNVYNPAAHALAGGRAAYHAAYNAKYRKDNKEALSVYCAEYRKDNKEAIRAKWSVKVQCECGSVVSRGNLYKHQRTAKHARLIQTAEDN